jgi:hypothetical protein
MEGFLRFQNISVDMLGMFKMCGIYLMTSPNLSNQIQTTTSVQLFFQKIKKMMKSFMLLMDSNG